MLTKLGKTIHKNVLRKLAKDMAGSHRARLLCEMLLLYVDGLIPLTLVTDVYGKKIAVPTEGLIDPEQLSKEMKQDLANMMTEFSLEEE